MSETSSSVPARLAIALVVCITTIGAAVWFIPTNPAPGPGTGEVGQSSGPETSGSPATDSDATNPTTTHRRFTAEQFRTAVDAVSSTEEARFEDAKPLWEKLVSAFPDDVDIRTCEAVAVLKWIEVLAGQLDSNSRDTTPEQRSATEKELEDAFNYAETVTSKLAKLEAYDYRIPLIRAEILKARANRLRYPDDTELKKLAAGILANALEENASQPLLVAAFDEAVMVLGGLAPELESKLPGFLLAGFQAQPDNYYLLKRTCEALLAAQDPRLKEVLPATIELTRPMWSTQQRYIDRQPPEPLVADCIAAIESGDWPKARIVRRWLNVILGMDGFQSDSKRVLPDPLGLLDTGFLHRLAPEPTHAPNVKAVDFDAIATTTVAKAVCWYDFDHDLQTDVVSGRDKELAFYTITSGKLSPGPVVATGKSINGILVADFFEVRTPDAPKLPNTVAELMLRGSVSRDVPDEPRVKPANGDQNDASQIVGTRHSTLRELLVWGTDGACIVTETDGSFAVVDSHTGLEELKSVTAIEVADIESDGDLDLLIVDEGKLKLYQNNGNRTFSNFSQYSILPPEGTTIHQIFSCDIDRDLDQDFLLATDSGLAIFENALHSQFRFRLLTGKNWSTAATTSIDVCDIDNNSSWDVVSTGGQGTTIVATQTPQPQQWDATQLESLPAATGNNVQTADINNDTFLDLILSGDQGISVCYGTRASQFSPAAKISDGSVAQLAMSDRDYDGTLELLCLLDGKPTVLSASSPPAGEYFNVRVAGINDDNGGGRINHYSIGTVLELWNGSKLQSQIVKSQSTHFGLGDSSLENLRIIFTNGLTQNVQDVVPNTLVEEIQLQRGSCPYVYGWDGQRWELITDLLWNAPLGLQVARGVTLKDRRWEHLLLPGALVQPKDGKIELRVTEELWEVAYFDQVKLTAVDHPEGTDVFTNEKVGPPSIAQHEIFSVQTKIHAQSATDAYDRDWTRRLSETDREYAQPFKRHFCQGLCEPHFVEMDFGKLPIETPGLRLFLNGWLYPTDTSLNIGISQNPDVHGPESASLWVVDKEGNWVCAKPTMGFPGGKPKTIAIDLAGVFHSQDHRIRIAASQELYWDEAFVAAGTGQEANSEQLVLQPLKLADANLHYRGYSQALPREHDQPHWFDYQNLTIAPKWPPLSGPYTRFGPVTELLASDDDLMVVIKGGDEFSLKFELPDQPLPEGWRRDYVLYSTGWDKDADINTIAGQGSLPLPFMDQTDYPAPFEQWQQAADTLRKNAQTLSRQGIERPSFAGKLGKAIAN